MTDREKMLYIGAVSLLIRLHQSLGSAFVSAAAARADFDADGDPLARLAADFNAQGFGVKVIENGSSFALVADEAARKPSRRRILRAGGWRREHIEEYRSRDNAGSGSRETAPFDLEVLRGED